MACRRSSAASPSTPQQAGRQAGGKQRETRGLPPPLSGAPKGACHPPSHHDSPPDTCTKPLPTHPALHFRSAEAVAGHPQPVWAWWRGWAGRQTVAGRGAGQRWGPMLCARLSVAAAHSGLPLPSCGALEGEVLKVQLLVRSTCSQPGCHGPPAAWSKAAAAAAAAAGGSRLEALACCSQSAPHCDVYAPLPATCGRAAACGVVGLCSRGAGRCLASVRCTFGADQVSLGALRLLLPALQAGAALCCLPRLLPALACPTLDVGAPPQVIGDLDGPTQHHRPTAAAATAASPALEPCRPS